MVRVALSFLAVLASWREKYCQIELNLRNFLPYVLRVPSFLAFLAPWREIFCQIEANASLGDLRASALKFFLHSSPGRARVRLRAACAFFPARRRSRDPLLGLVGRRRLGGTAAAASRRRRRSSTAALLRD